VTEHVQFGYHRYCHRQPDGTFTALCICGWKWLKCPDLATAVDILAGHGDTNDEIDSAFGRLSCPFPVDAPDHPCVTP